MGEARRMPGPTIITRQELTAIQVGIATMNTKLDRLLEDYDKTDKQIAALDRRVVALELANAGQQAGKATLNRGADLILALVSALAAVFGTTLVQGLMK